MYMPKDEGNFELAPEGAHSAVCYRVIDLGTQQGDYMGQPKRQHKILINWEMPGALMTDGRPFSIGRKYTFSSSTKSALRQDLESWRGKPFTEADLSGAPGAFDIKNLLGAPCLLNVVHEVKQTGTFANIRSIMRLPKEMAKPKPVNAFVYFSLADRPFNRAVFDALSENMRALIAKSPEYAEAVNPARTNDHDAPEERGGGEAGFNDDVPFAPSMI